MAVIYARLGEIKLFRDLWQGLHTRLEGAVLQREEPIAKARHTIEEGVDRAREIRDKARNALDKARSDLERAKHTEHGPSQWHYRRVAHCEQACDFADRQLDRLEREQESFFNGTVRCTTRQDQALELIQALGKKGVDRLDAYTELLRQAKRALMVDAPAGSGSFVTPDGGYVDARELTEEEAQALAQKTGWNQRTLKQCQLRPDGSVWLKTNNSIQDGVTYNGTWFERDTVVIGEVRLEGIFPKFDAVFQPDESLPQSQWKIGNREHHFAWCREQLARAVEERPALAAQFTAKERQLIAARKPLPDYTWHHHQQPGRMQLVPSDKHSAGMHGVSHTGGYALWCAGEPKE